MSVDDPHREAGCNWQRGNRRWVSLLDYAVYHAPGWEAWQRYRKAMVGMKTDQKLKVLKQWPLNSVWDLIRVLNYTRSLRALWGGHPSLVDYNRYVNSLYRRFTDQHGFPEPEEEAEGARVEAQ